MQACKPDTRAGEQPGWQCAGAAFPGSAVLGSAPGRTVPGSRAHLTRPQGAQQCAGAHHTRQQGTPYPAAVLRGAPSWQQGTGVHNVLAQNGVEISSQVIVELINDPC